MDIGHVLMISIIACGGLIMYIAWRTLREAKNPTKKQIAALRYMIFNAKNGTDLTKQVMAFLIDQSEGLTKDVCLTFVDGREGYSAEEISDAARGLDGMLSSNGTTHIDQVMHAMGIETSFSIHYGDFDSSREGDPFSSAGIFAGRDISQVSDVDDIFEGMPMRYTFWLARKDYSREAEYVEATREVVEEINLKKSGLYPTLEPA